MVNNRSQQLQEVAVAKGLRRKVGDVAFAVSADIMRVLVKKLKRRLAKKNLIDFSVYIVLL